MGTATVLLAYLLGLLFFLALTILVIGYANKIKCRDAAMKLMVQALIQIAKKQGVEDSEMQVLQSKREELDSL